MKLYIETVWLIECWRCANNSTTDTDTKAKDARAEFEAAGWTQTDNGYQLCSSCNKAVAQ
jgi:hypothetical protein